MYRFFEPAMDARIKARRALELDMRKAVTGGEFRGALQPVSTSKVNRICGCEACLRWPHPERGFGLAGRFHSDAEETGLIVSLGEWVLQRACAMRRRGRTI